jgi:hypothetical protein
MPSITYWSQLQPNPRAIAIAESLAARLRDPAWLLARQWQMGEFHGGDCGSPAFARITSRTAALASVRLGSAERAVGTNEQLEPLVGREPLGADLATRVEVGQLFESILERAQMDVAVRDVFRATYPIAAGTSVDEETSRFLHVIAGRAIDGVALYAAAVEARAAGFDLPSQPAIDASIRSQMVDLVASFVARVDATWGALGADDPPAWNAERLEYRFDATAGIENGATLTLAAVPDPEADLDWYAFDLTQVTGDLAAGPVKTTSVMPGHVRFRGMPNARWWDFETGKSDFGAILAETRDLAKLLFMDFMLIHGDDWYLAPLEVSPGSLTLVDSLEVTDVFGVVTAIPRADGARWNMFATTDRRSGALAPFLVVPAQAPALQGAPIEEVHLLRDETADMAWAIETIVEGPTGVARLAPLPPVLGVPADAPAPLVYELATPSPGNWYPLLPTATPGGAVALTLGSVEGAELAPSSRIVQRLAAPGFVLPEEEVPRAGVRIVRVVCRARSGDGRTHFWIARRKQYGAGEAASGLAYDLALDVV